MHQALILDSSAERAFDDITRLLASTLDVPITMVNLLDAQRDWFKSRVGIQQTQSSAATSFCEVFFTSTSDVIVAEDTLLDPRFASHPMVAGRPYIRFYAAARLMAHGQTIGTLCAYDTRPRKLTPEQLADLQAMANATTELIGRRREGLELSATGG